jgi:hypothetical protein
MTRSKNFGRLLQVTCLGLIGMLAVVGCGGSETTPNRDSGPGVGAEAGISTAYLNVTPSTVNLGTLDVGAKGVATVTVTNTGKATSGALAVTATAGVTVAGCTGQQLAANASCTITITAAPTALGTFTGTVSISAAPGASPTPLTVSVIANVAPPGLFSVTPAAIALGNIPVGTPAPKQTITVTAALAINDLAVSLNGVDVSKDATGTCTTILAAGASCTVVVNFTAASAGSRSDSVTISGGGASGKTVTVPITATAQNPAKLVITPNVPQTLVATAGQTSPALNFGVANSGDVASGSIVVNVTGINAADFTATSTCLLLAPLSGCTVSVVFKPAAGSTTAETATLVVTDSGVGASTVSVALTGTPVGQSALAITPATSDLGSVLVGTTGASTVFTVTNGGDTATGALTVSISSAEFLITNDTCSSAASLVAKTGNCTISIALKPATIGAKSATLTVTPASGNAVYRGLTGTAVSAPGLSASPVSLDFGSVRVNNTSSAQTVTVTNIGGTATGVLTFTKTGDFGMFPLGANTCSAALAPAAKCTFSVNFAPTGAVTTAGKAASYTVTDGIVSVTISVSGTALEAAPLSIVDPLDHLVVTSVKSCVRPSIDATGDNICVTDTVLGATSVVTATVAVHMGTLPAGSTDSGAITAAMGGTNKGDFSILKNNCTAALLANSECTLTIAFVPTAAGVRQAVLNVTSTNGGSANASFQAIGLAVMQIVAGSTAAQGGPPPLKADGTLEDLKLDFGQVPLNGSITDRTNWYGVLVRGPLPAVKPTATAPAPTNTLTIQLNNTAVPADFNYTLGQLANPCTGVTIAFDQFTTPSIVGSVTGTNSAKWYPAPSEYGVWCEFEIEFYPQTSKGDKTATVAASGSGGGSDTVTLTGTATGPLIITPSQAGFPGQLAVNDSTNNDFTSPITFTTISMVQNPNLTLTVENTSTTTDIGPITVALSGTNADQFIIVNDQCSDKSTLLAKEIGRAHV